MPACRALLRVRPPHSSGREAAHSTCALKSIDAHSVAVQSAGKTGRSFEVDTQLWGHARQEDVWGAVGSTLVRSLLEGVSCSLIAIGPSGGGKRFTMTGTAEEPGFAPRALRALCGTDREELRLELCMLEVYADQVLDLLSAQPGPPSTVHLHTGEHPTVWYTDPEGSDPAITLGEDCWYAFGSSEQAEALLHVGESRRTTRATSLHAAAARSHVLVYIRATRLRQLGVGAAAAAVAPPTTEPPGVPSEADASSQQDGGSSGL